MTHTPMPAELHNWVARYMPGPNTWADASWPRSTSQVWRVTGSSAAAYVKISPTVDAFDREVHAYAHAADALAGDRAPRLIAHDRSVRALLTSALAGRVVRDLPVPDDEEIQIHRSAGNLLRLWHGLPEAVPADARDKVSASMTAQAAEAASSLTTIGAHLSGPEHALVQETANDLPALAANLTLVYLHGDYSPRNWLWHATAQIVGAIDFEMAGHGLAVQDMIWLAGAVWPTKPALQEAFLGAYHRDLNADESRVLLLLTARLAVSYLTTGLTQRNKVLIDRGRNALGNLTRARV